MSSRKQQQQQQQLGQKSSESPLGPVPFQGIGTRLRRSRSKDHSNELDNLSTSHFHHQQPNGPVTAMEIASLTRNQHSSSRNNVAAYDHSGNFGLSFSNKGTGTLERPKRLMTAYNNGGGFPTESSTFIQQQPLYGGTRNIYEETRLLGHQYEEPHLVMDRDLLYDANPAYSGRHRSSGKQQQTADSYLQNGDGKHYSGNHQRIPPLPSEHCPADLAAAYHSYMALDGVGNISGTLSTRPNMTVIPPSKLFGKNLSTSYNATNGRLETASKSSEGLEYSPKSTATSSSMSSTITSGRQQQQSMLMTNNSANNSASSRQQSKELACGNESDSSTTKADSGLQLLTRTSHELSTSSSSGGENGGTHLHQPHHPHHHHIDRTFHDQETEPAIDSPPKLSSSSHHHLTSSSQSSVMHTYANPFQTSGGGGSGGSPYSEDTTGPIIPDLNTLRPSQLLKNSFAGSGPPPGLHSGSIATTAASASSANRRTPNVISYLSSLWSSAMGGPGGSGDPHQRFNHPHHPHDQKSVDGGLSKHRCSWRRSTLLLLILVFVLFLVIILLCALSSAPEGNGISSSSSSLQGRFSELNPKVPCIVVEDLDTSSANFNFASASSYSNAFDRSTSDSFPGDSSHRSSSSSSSSEQLSSNHCPLSLPRDSSYFKEIRLPPESGNHHQQPMSFRLAPLTSWTVWFSVTEASYINFQFYAPLHARFALLAAKNEPPTLAVHQIFQVISDEALAKNKSKQPASTNRHRLQRRSPAAAGHREAQLLQLQSTHYFEPSTWYLTLQNDLDYTVPLVVNLSTTTKYPSSASNLDRNQQQQCPNGCHNQGHCNPDTGKCQCFPGFLGHDCSETVCPVFCGGHGQYLQGSCRCSAGWKGRECTVRVNECEVADCSGNGVCIEGVCQCRSGFKGEHCDLADCLDPLCSERGVCLEGTCLCKVGWSGTNCSQPDSRLHSIFLPNCSRNGVYDVESGRCLCYEHYTGADCSQLRCSLDCGLHGICEDGRCRCEEGWSGPLCRSRQCDTRCLEHGRCVNGSCVCTEGWMGRHCTLDGCPNGCSKHGRCVDTTTNSKSGASSFKQQAEVSKTGSFDHHHHHHLKQSSPVVTAQFWSCRCDEGWGGADCSSAQETNCNDEIDNDNDGLVDCADSECCRHESCHQSLMCITSPDPLDILLRKQPSSPISSFFTKVNFLIEDGSVQSYAQKDAYSERRVSVIRGQVVSREFNGLIGVRVSVTTEPTFGFTLTRSGGWFDLLVNGGGMVTLQFQRNPLYPIKKELYVAWNEVAVIQNPVIMYSVPESSSLDGPLGPILGGSQLLMGLPSRAFSYSIYSHFLLPGFDLSESNWSLARKLSSTESANNSSTRNTADHCAQHDNESLRPSIQRSSIDGIVWLAKNSGTVCATPSESCILAESAAVHERIPIGGSQMRLVYQSTMAAGYLATVTVRLTQPGSRIPSALRFILARLLVEGTVQERILEADEDLLVTFTWNKRNVYKQKVYGFVPAKIYVGYLYSGCPTVVWSSLYTKLRGFDMEISELGGWNLEVHHRYNHFDGLLQRGDGEVVSFREEAAVGGSNLFIEPIAGRHMQPRPFTCSSSSGEPATCGSTLSSVRFFGLTSLTAAPDGSLYVGDGNLIRRISPDGRVQTMYTFKQYSNSGSSGGSNSGSSNGGEGGGGVSGSGSTAYEYYVAFNSLDGCLYIADPERLQIVRLLLNDQKQFEQQSGAGVGQQQQQQQYQSDGVSGFLPEVEVVIGTGERCLPHDRAQCGDGKQGLEVTLAYPKGIAFGLDGSLFFADGSVIRVLDAASGVVRRLVGDGSKAGGRQQWTPANARPSSNSGCLAARPANEMRLHWPTSLAVNPLDGALYFVDSFVVFKLNHQLQVAIVAGMPAYCAEEASTSASSGSFSAQNSTCQSSSFSTNNHHRLDARHFSACGEDILFGAITFTPSGTLYASDISRQSENRVYALNADGEGTLVHVAGFRSNGSPSSEDGSSSSSSLPNCSVERCTDIGGHNCTCLIAAASSEGSSGTPKDTDYTSPLTDLTLGISARLFSVSGLAAAGDGAIYIADEGSLRLFRLGPFSPVLPTAAPSLDGGSDRQIKIISPNRGEMYNFNRHGQHMSTRSTASGRTLFTFHYSQESASLGRLTDVVDAAGNRLSFLRDPTGALHSIESSTGFKALTAVNKAGLLEAIGTRGGGMNGSLLLDYYPTTGLLRSKVDTSSGGATTFYLYSADGRVMGAVSPTGSVTSLTQSNHLSDDHQQTVTVVSASTSSPFAANDQSSTFQVLITPSTASSTTVRLVQTSDQITVVELTAHSDGSLLVNGSGTTARHLQATFAGKASKLSRAMLPIQAQMFPLIAHAQVEQPGSGKSELLGLSLDLGLKMKSNIIGAVEKYVVIGGNSNASQPAQLALKMEYDWKANREIYYNGSQRPILYLQFDEAGRPIQWVPNLQPRASSGGSGGNQLTWWPAHSLSYDKAGQLAGWQDGTRTVAYSRDRVGRLVEVRGQGEHFVRYTYGDEGSETTDAKNDVNHQQPNQLPSSVTLRSGHKYHFELLDSGSGGRLKGIVTPKGTRHQLWLKVLLGFTRFAYCPPMVESKLASHSTANCYLTYFADEGRPVMSVLPYDHGKVIYRYGQRSSVLLPKVFAKEEPVGQTSEVGNADASPIAVDQVLFGGGGATERWYDRKSGADLRGIWRSGSSSLSDRTSIQDYILLYKYTRNTGQLKHLSAQFGGVGSQLSAALSTLTYSYRYDGQNRLRAIQAKLGTGISSGATINLPALEFTYNSADGQKSSLVETMAAFRYFERSANESLLGDGVALYVKRFESSAAGRSQPLPIRHASLTIADREVFRVDYSYETSAARMKPLLTQTRAYSRHHHQLIANGANGNKMRLQNFTYDAEGQLVEVQGREHWRFVYDFNGNLVTFLYLGNRIDIDYDSADRVRNFGKGTEHGGTSSSASSSSTSSTSSSGSSPYITDLRGFVVQRGDEQLRYSSLGQLLSSSRPNRHQIDYTYDYKGRLVVRRDQAGNATQFFYGNPSKPYLVTHALSAGGQVISLLYDDVDDSLLSVRLNGGTTDQNSIYYVVCDQARSPLLVFDARGSVVKELHRSPYGHVLFDSNPTFYLPVDFQGGIADPLTNLVHFPAAAGRVYDTLTGRWMTPVLDARAFLLQQNLIERPRLLHQYQFNGNDPISGYGEDLVVITADSPRDSIFSTASQFAEKLRLSTSLLISEADPSLSPLKLLTHLQELLPADLVQGKSQHSPSSLSSTPVRSQHFTSLAFIIDELRQFASFKTGYFSKLTQEDNWTSAKSMWRLIATDSVLGFGGSAGVLLAKTSWSPDGGGGDDHQLRVLAHSRVNGLLVEFLNRAVNGSVLLDAHLVMSGQDHLYLVHEALPDSHSLAQLKSNKYLGVLAPGAVNYTVNTGELEKKPFVDVRISLDTVILNVRFGTTLPKERERVLRLAKKYSLLTRLSQERMALLQGHPRASFSSSNQWSEEEKQFILSPDRHANQLAGNGSPLKADYYHSSMICPQLADDATNIALKSRRSHHN